MNPAAALSLILDLYAQATESARRVAQLEAENTDLRSKVDPPDVKPSNKVDAP